MTTALFPPDLAQAVKKARPVEQFRFPLGMEPKDICTVTTPWPLLPEEFDYVFRVLEVMKPGLVEGADL